MKIKTSQLRQIIKEELLEVSIEKTGMAKTIDKFGTAAIGVGVTVGSLVGTPALGSAIGGLGLLIRDKLDAGWSKNKLKDVELTEDILVDIVDDAIADVDFKNQDDVDDVVQAVKADIDGRLEGLDSEVKNSLKFDEHLIKRANGSKEAKHVLTRALKTLNLFGGDTATKKVTRALQFATSPSKWKDAVMGSSKPADSLPEPSAAE